MHHYRGIHQATLSYQVAIVGVNAARTDQADEMQPPVRPGCPKAGVNEGRTHRKAAVRDRGIDPGQVLEDRATGPEVEVTDLGIAHLPGRQSDGVLGCPERGVRPVAQETTPDGHVGGGDGVGGRVATDPEPVEHDQDDGSWPGNSAMLRRHPVEPRAAAVTPARATIPAISSGLSNAPPTRAPSIDGSAMNSSIAADVTLPP